MADSKNKPSRLISNEDRITLQGWKSIYREEPEQIYPGKFIDQTLEDAPSQRLKNTRENSNALLSKIRELENKVDERCSHLKLSTLEEVGSPLFQAMVRVFNKRTTNITYQDYKQALEIRKQLIEEDKKDLRKT